LILNVFYTITAFVVAVYAIRTFRVTRSEVKNQSQHYEEEIRPVISIALVNVNGTVVLRIKNEGNRTAESIKVRTNGNDYSEYGYQFQKMMGSVFSISSQEYFDIRIGHIISGGSIATSFTKIPEIMDFYVEYYSDKKRFEDEFHIEIRSYDWIENVKC